MIRKIASEFASFYQTAFAADLPREGGKIDSAGYQQGTSWHSQQNTSSNVPPPSLEVSDVTPPRKKSKTTFSPNSKVRIIQLEDEIVSLKDHVASLSRQMAVLSDQYRTSRPAHLPPPSDILIKQPQMSAQSTSRLVNVDMLRDGKNRLRRVAQIVNSSGTPEVSAQRAEGVLHRKVSLVGVRTRTGSVLTTSTQRPITPAKRKRQSSGNMR